MDERKERCETCRFWHEDKTGSDPVCRRFPPSPVYRHDTRDPEIILWHRAVFPCVEEHDWCGEWQATTHPLTHILPKEWSVRAVRFFEENNIGTLEKLCSFTREQLLKMNRTASKQSEYLIDGIECELSKKGMSLRQSC